jgi:hypothetical protein
MCFSQAVSDIEQGLRFCDLLQNVDIVGFDTNFSLLVQNLIDTSQFIPGEGELKVGNLLSSFNDVFKVNHILADKGVKPVLKQLYGLTMLLGRGHWLIITDSLQSYCFTGHCK